MVITCFTSFNTNEQRNSPGMSIAFLHENIIHYFLLFFGGGGGGVFNSLIEIIDLGFERDLLNISQLIY